MTKVLIVDDSAAYRDCLQKLLSLSGLEVAAAADGNEAMTLAADFGPDVLVIDWMLGSHTDGIELAKLMRTSTPEIPVIMISGFPSTPIDRNLTSLAHTQFLAKPFATAKLLSAIRAAAEGAARPGR